MIVNGVRISSNRKVRCQNTVKVRYLYMICTMIFEHIKGFCIMLCNNLDNATYRDAYRVIVIKIVNFLLSIIQDNSKFSVDYRRQLS